MHCIDLHFTKQKLSFAEYCDIISFLSTILLEQNFARGAGRLNSCKTRLSLKIREKGELKMNGELIDE